MTPIYIYGKHPVEEALMARPESIGRLFLDKGDYPELDELAKKHEVFRSALDMKTLRKHIGEHAVHQNIVALVDAEKLMQPFEDFIQTIDITKKPSLVLLGEIQDPQNVGAIIRSAAAFGISGVLIPKDRQAQITGSVIKASAGMAFKIPLVSIGNVNQTVRDLKEKDFWIYGLSGDGEKILKDESFDEPSVFIVGNEGKGIREKTQEHCDIVLKIPISKNAESLNAAASSAVVFYEWSRERKLK